jgi:hypothetical protein
MIQFPPSLKVIKTVVISLTIQIEFEAGLKTETETEADEDENEFTFWMALRKSGVNVDFWIHSIACFIHNRFFNTKT